MYLDEEPFEDDGSDSNNTRKDRGRSGSSQFSIASIMSSPTPPLQNQQEQGQIPMGTQRQSQSQIQSQVQPGHERQQQQRQGELERQREILHMSTQLEPQPGPIKQEFTWDDLAAYQERMADMQGLLLRNQQARYRSSFDDASGGFFPDTDRPRFF